MSDATLAVNGVTIGIVNAIELTPAAKPDHQEAVLVDGVVSGQLSIDLADSRLLEKARRSCVSQLTIDVAPMLDRWLESPTAFARVVFGRELSEWERKSVIAARWSVDVAGVADRLDALRIIAGAMRRALGSSPAQARKLRKRQHLEMVRYFRSHPTSFRDVQYRHRWIRARCGVCRTLYATETFISFTRTVGHAQPGRRMYVVEQEGILDCGHASMYLYPVEWEADGYVSPNLCAGA